MEKKKSKGKLIALIIAIVVVVGVVTTGIVLAATGTLFGSTKEKAFDLLKQAPEKMTQSAVSKQLGLDELSKAMLEKGMDINYKIKDIHSSDSSVDLSGMEMGAGLSLDVNNKKASAKSALTKDGSQLSAEAYGSLEQKKADVQTIRSLRVAAMGPLGGIGDAIFWFTLLPIAAGVGANLALEGSIAGPIIFLLMFNIVHLGLRFWLMHWSYKTGIEGITKITKNAKEFTRAATILGMIVVGALIASYVSIDIVTEIPIGETSLKVQEILDGIMPKLLPLGLTFGMYGLVKKNVSPMINILIMVLIGIAGAYIGLF